MITKEYLQQELAKRIDGYKSGVETTTDNIIAEMKSILVLVNGLEDNKYNDALKRAEVAYKDTDKHIKATIERIFPELHESEDERIRKKCMDFISKWSSKEDRDECLAYLEKQKESLGGTFSSYEMAKTFTDGQNYVMKHPEKFGLQKFAEWSEEDEKMLWSAINGLNIHIYEKERAWLANKLKSLRPQPHWKPSEEQMEELKDASAIMKCDSDDNVFPSLKTLYDDLKKL